MIKIIKWTKEQITPLSKLIMVDDQDLYGVYTWEHAIAQIALFNALSYKEHCNWRLPTIEELNWIYLEKDVVGGFASSYYWSSSEYSKYLAWVQSFNYGTQSNNNKNDTIFVRAVRDM